QPAGPRDRGLRGETGEDDRVQRHQHRQTDQHQHDPLRALGGERGLLVPDGPRGASTRPPGRHGLGDGAGGDALTAGLTGVGRTWPYRGAHAFWYTPASPNRCATLLAPSTRIMLTTPFRSPAAAA